MSGLLGGMGRGRGIGGAGMDYPRPGSGRADSWQFRHSWHRYGWWWNGWPRPGMGGLGMGGGLGSSMRGVVFDRLLN